MNETETLISDALHDLARQAAAPPPMADAAWRAGRRRRLFSMTTVSTAAAVGAAAVVLSFAVIGSPGHVGGSTPGAGQPAATRVALRTPIQFEQVASISHKPCPAGAERVPGPAPARCVHLTGTGMTINGAASAKVQQTPQGSYMVDIRLSPADSRVFEAMTQKLAGLRSPLNQFAIIADGRVLARPAVEAAFRVGLVQIEVATRALAEHLVRHLPSR